MDLFPALLLASGGLFSAFQIYKMAKKYYPFLNDEDEYFDESYLWLEPGSNFFDYYSNWGKKRNV